MPSSFRLLNYSPLSNSENQNVDFDSESFPLVPSEQWALRPSPSHKVITVASNIFYLGLGAILSIVVNLILLHILVSSNTYPLYNLSSAVSLRDLTHPSQYIGLDRVARPVNNQTSRKKPLRRINHPDVLVQINARNSAQTYLHIINRTSNFLISDKVSTIAQFRAADYGLTRCAIGFVVPSLNDLANTSKIYNSTWDPQGFHVDVWQANFNSELDRDTISLGRRSSLSMPRQDKLATFNMRADSKSRTPDFPCTSGEWYTFEFTTSSESRGVGAVSLRQDQALPTLGIYMRQKEAY